MREIFYPGSVAVIGVSNQPQNLGRVIVTNLVEYGFDGVVYAVGPAGGSTATHPIYRSVLDIPGPVDQAVIITPARTVPGILEECGQKGIRWAVIQTAGFREYGEQGRQLEDEMVRVADKYGIRFVGPNCIGAINMENGYCVPFMRMKWFSKKGDVSIITQSGGVGMSALNHMETEGIGLSKFVSVGNMLNISAEDILEYLIEDPGTRTIFLYLEGIQDGRRLMEIARRSPKPILAFKSNIGKLGQNIAASHTASLSSDDKVVDAAFRQAGIIRINDATSLVNTLKILELPPMRGQNVAIISRSGGHAVIATDALENSKLRQAHFPDEFLREIEKHFRASVIKLTNPLDLGDLFDLDLYARIVDQTLQLEGVDGVVFLNTSLLEREPGGTRILIDRLVEMVEKYNKPVAYYLLTSTDMMDSLRQTYKFPLFSQVVETVRALENSFRYCCEHDQAQSCAEPPTFVVDRQAVRLLLDQAKAQGRDLLLNEAVQVLQAYGIPALPDVTATSLEQALAAAELVGYPVAIKVISGQISHKSDAGGVALNLCDADAVRSAYREMVKRLKSAYPQVEPDGVLVQPMLTGGWELILGGRQDKQFGPVVLVGLGGIFTELFEEVSVRVAPISQTVALNMIDDLRGAQSLKGARGQKPADLEAVVDALLRVSQLLVDFPEIQELDINPLKVFEQGCWALDARLVLDGSS